MSETQDNLTEQAPQRAYLFPTNDGAVQSSKGKQTLPQEVALFFQYWPQSLQDDYGVEYAEHQIPGGSHPLYQWVGGRGRTITFEAIFTAELNQLRNIGDSFTGIAAGISAAVSGDLVPSSDFTVNVASALARIRSWMMPEYSGGGRLGETKPPEILTLVFPNTKLGGTTDLVQVILRSAPITIESWYPNGEIRVATVNFTFNEVVQNGGSGQANATKVKFLGRNRFSQDAQGYKFRGLSDRPFIGGS